MAELLTTAIVLLYDVVGSTRLRGKLGDVEAERVLRALDQRVSEVVTGGRGEIVKGTGDGQLAIFTAAGDALTAAGAIHRAAQSLTLRMGISAGDCVLSPPMVRCWCPMWSGFSRARGIVTGSTMADGAS
jgi:class 3 adenylate cyclase